MVESAAVKKLMRRSRNPRRVALEVLRAMKNNVSIMIATWDQQQQQWFVEEGKSVHRPLTAEEKFENQPDQWERLAQFMDVVAKQAQEMAAFARERAKVAEEAQAQARCPHDGCGLAWIEDNYICPKCGDEWSYRQIHGGELST